MQSLFRHDFWIGDGPLAVAFPLLFGLAREKNCTVGANLGSLLSEGSHEFWRRLRLNEQHSLDQLLILLKNVQLGSSEVQDAYFWKPTKSVYTTKSLVDLSVPDLDEIRMANFNSCLKFLAPP